MDLQIVLKTDNELIRQHYEQFIENNCARQDSGLDMPMPQAGAIEINAKGVLIPLGVCVRATYNAEPAAYYLCPRSSMPLKTPLRMANAPGIIDCGYKGELKAIVDHCGSRQGHEDLIDTFHYKAGDRLFQIVSPDLKPFRSITIVDDIGVSVRDQGGFGSTSHNIT